MVMKEATPVAALEPKTRLTGKIVKITLAGALVDLGQALPGVLHISQLRKNRVNKVEDVIQVGDGVDVWVRRVRKDRIELTMIEPLRYEWKDLEPESVVRGRVVRLESYGAFIEFGAERPGMIHISELSSAYVKDPRDVVKEGDEVDAKILSVDPKKRQIRLSLKALQPEAEDADGPEHPPKRGPRSEKAVEVETSPEPEETAEEQLTAMQIAWDKAQQRTRSKSRETRPRRQKESDPEQEEILSRTLESRLPTGT